MKAIKVDEVRMKLKRIAENISMMNVHMQASYIQPMVLSQFDLGEEEKSHSKLLNALTESLSSMQQQPYPA